MIYNDCEFYSLHYSNPVPQYGQITPPLDHHLSIEQNKSLIFKG